MPRVRALALLFAGYLAAAKIGLLFASIHPSASAIWPPTGIALAAFLILGRDAWPAVFVAAFLANVTTDGSIATSIGIAAGNTLEGVLGAYLVERFAHGRRAFDHPQDIFRFAALGGLLSPMVAATTGVTSLALGGYAPWSDYASIWMTWWLGDAAGALLVAPLILTWKSNAPFRWDRAAILEASFLLLALLVVAAGVFGGLYPPTRNFPLTFCCIPILVWTAFRFGQRETSAAIVILAAVAAAGTLRGSGPFGLAPPNDRLLLLQAFMGTMAVMAMSITALVTDQQRLLVAERGARAEAETANLAKDTFLAMLGHELRNPLAAITTAVAVLESDASRDRQKSGHILQVVTRQVGQLARLVDDLLDVTRVTTGKIVLHRTRTELGEMVGRSLDALRATGKTDHHEIDYRRQTVWVDVDESRLEQVVTNLVTNALKYTPPGGAIRVSVAARQEWAVLSVEDTGMGIAPETLPQIFNLFTQGDRDLDRSQGGLGIGLTLVKRLVELHGGRVDATSAGPGLGSQFTVRLRAALPRRATDPVPEPPRVSQPRRVLIVEDQPDAREMLLIALQLAGHEVVEASDGPQGIDAASRHRPECAVIDVGLPGCDGYEVARQIRRMADGELIFLVALTGYGQPEDRRRAEEAGFDLHLVKPVDPSRLNVLLSGNLTPRRSGAARPS